MKKALQLQTKYMSTHRTRITIHGLLLNINKDHMGAFFVLYGQVEEAAHILCVPSKNFSVQVILDRMKLQEIPDILVCRSKRIFVVVEGRRPLVVWDHWSLSKNVSQLKTDASASYIQGNGGR